MTIAGTLWYVNLVPIIRLGEGWYWVPCSLRQFWVSRAEGREGRGCCFFALIFCVKERKKKRKAWERERERERERELHVCVWGWELGGRGHGRCHWSKCKRINYFARTGQESLNSFEWVSILILRHSVTIPQQIKVLLMRRINCCWTGRSFVFAFNTSSFLLYL